MVQRTYHWDLVLLEINLILSFECNNDLKNTIKGVYSIQFCQINVSLLSFIIRKNDGISVLSHKDSILKEASCSECGFLLVLLLLCHPFYTFS